MTGQSQIPRLGASPVASIVSKVDGLPLAIELAAARLRMLSPKALAERLSRSLDALGSGAPDLPSRQKTLDAAIDWSYQLLTREEQDLFQRLCVFPGGFTVESAQEVAIEEDDLADVPGDPQSAGEGQDRARAHRVRQTEGEAAARREVDPIAAGEELLLDAAAVDVDGAVRRDEVVQVLRARITLPVPPLAFCPGVQVTLFAHPFACER